MHVSIFSPSGAAARLPLQLGKFEKLVSNSLTMSHNRRLKVTHNLFENFWLWYQNMGSIISGKI